MQNIIQRITSTGGRAKVWRTFAMVMVFLFVGLFIVGGGFYNQGADWLAQKTKINLPHTKVVQFRLGLDLLGGTQLTYQADVSAIPAKDQASAVEGVRDVLERRVNVFGVAEPNIQTSVSGGKYYVTVELAGIKDVAQAIKMIGETPLLEFKEMNTAVRSLTKDEQAKIDKTNKAAQAKAVDILGKVLANGNFASLANSYSEDPANTDSKGAKLGGELGWINEKDNKELFDLAAKIGKGKTSNDIATTSAGYEIIQVEDQRVKTDPFNNQPQKEVDAAHLLICYNGVSGCESGLSKDEALVKIKELKAKATPANFKDLVKQNSTEPGAREKAGELGWFGRGTMVPAFENEVFTQKVGTISDPVETEFGFHLIYKEGERDVLEYKVRHILIKTISASDIIGNQSEWKNTELTGKNLQQATVEFNPNDNSPEVSLVFDDAGAKLFADITQRNVGKQVAIYLDGYPISSPTVNEAITGGKAVISGKFTVQEAQLLAQRLNAGALPVPINLVNQQTIGASLGQKSVDDSLKAGLIGFALVALFMIIFYRLPGVLAIMALAIYGVLVLAIFKVWPVTLTLSGLAGFIMSIGMAVDANVLIFSRFREELKNGRPLGMAIEEGFRRAWPSIRDSNASTLITCFILIQFTTSVVKGFAFTLGIGVIVSMFTAIFVTRTFLQLIPEKWLTKQPWLVGAAKK